MTATTAPDHPLIATVEARFSGVLTKGAHSPDGAACLHEAINVARGLDWTDSPGGMPDLRGLNDAPWSSDEVRTKHLLPVGVALYDWSDWSEDRRVAFAGKVAERTIRVVLPMALRAAGAVHPDREHRETLEAAAKQCADEGTKSAAWSAARSAAEAAEAAAEAAWSAARSAAWSARSAAAEAAEAARSAESASAAWSAARSAARSASAAWSAGSAGSAERSDEPLIAICSILVEAAEGTR